MRDLVLAIVVSVLISAGISYWMVRQLRNEQAVTLSSTSKPVAAMRRTAPTIVSILVSPIGGNRCTATTDPIVQSVGAGPVHWIVRRFGNNVNKCFENGETVKIVPKSGNTSPLTPTEPFHDRLIKADHGNITLNYYYQVWMANASGGNLYLMEDPELEIVEVRGAGQQ